MPRSRNSEILTLWKLGWTSGDIAAKLKISRNTVMGVVHRARLAGENLERRIPDPPPVEAKRMPKKPPMTSLSAPPPPKKEAAPIEPEIVAVFTPPPPPPKKKGKPKKILELGAFDCRWIVSPGKYCGEHAVSARTPWCDEHYGIVYYRGSARKA